MRRHHVELLAQASQANQPHLAFVEPAEALHRLASLVRGLWLRRLNPLTEDDLRGSLKRGIRRGEHRHVS